MYVLDAGRLTKRVEIWEYQERETEWGKRKVELTKKAEVWADIHPVRGTEFLEYYRDANALQYKITIRYRQGITEKDVLVRGKRQFEINSIINVNEENVALEIYCTETKDKVIAANG